MSHGRYTVYQNSLIPLGKYDKCNTPPDTTFIIAAGSAGEIGYSQEQFWAADDCYYLIPNEGVVSKFLFYSLLGHQSQISGSVRHGSVPRLARDVMGNLELRLPEGVIQHKITDALTSIDIQISAIQKLLSKYESIKKATVKKLMTPKDGWKQYKLEDIFEIQIGGDLDIEHYSANKTATHCYEIVSNSLTNRGLYGYTSLPLYSADSITVTGRGNVGHAEYRKEAFDAIIRIVVLTPKESNVCSKFISELINSTCPFQIESTGVPQLTAPQIASTKIIIPTVCEQKQAVETLDALDNITDRLMIQLAKVHKVKSSMLQYFFGD
ncbi:MAG: restriction endonuclease subunit S [Victivallales bacterium]|nr:restriction endonuclease subunit S [Victivallales bacterium]